jgi:hypothetical protein
VDPEEESGRVDGGCSALVVSGTSVTFVIDGDPDDDGGPLRDMGPSVPEAILRRNLAGYVSGEA